MKYLIVVISFIFIFNCMKNTRPEPKRPFKKLSQKEQILKIIEFKVEHSDDFTEKVTLQDLKYTILSKVED